MDDTFSVKIIDFGFSKVMNKAIESEGMWARIGNNFTRAPETEEGE